MARIDTMNDRINAAIQRGYQARENGEDTLHNPFCYSDFKAEHQAWRKGWIRHQAIQNKWMEE